MTKDKRSIVCQVQCSSYGNITLHAVHQLYQKTCIKIQFMSLPSSSEEIPSHEHLILHAIDWRIKISAFIVDGDIELIVVQNESFVPL